MHVHTLPLCPPPRRRRPRSPPPPSPGCQRSGVRCQAAAEGSKAAIGSTPVPKNSILVVGATGTLGRQVVRRALDEGYDVRCIVRPRLSPADFLRDWGATTVQADLTDPSSLPAALVGVSAVIDCATARPEESTDKVGGWAGGWVRAGHEGCGGQLHGTHSGAAIAMHGSALSPLSPLACPTACPQVDWEGKVGLIQCAQAMGIQR